MRSEATAFTAGVSDLTGALKALPVLLRRTGEGLALWSREDGFFHDVLHLPDGRHFPLKVRSLVGLIPLFAVESLESGVVDRLPGFKRRMQWFLRNRPELASHVQTRTEPDGRIRRFLSLVNGERLRSVLGYMLDEEEFLSPHGVRSLSRVHRDRPYVLRLNGTAEAVIDGDAQTRRGKKLLEQPLHLHAIATCLHRRGGQPAAVCCRRGAQDR